MTLNHALFAVMSLVWGATWIAAKAAITAVPPAFLGAARFVLVGLVLSLVVRGVADLFRGERLGRTVATGLLVNTGTYGLVFAGMRDVSSGVAALVNLPLIVVGLYGLSLLFGDERPSWRHAVALVLGLAGLAALFWDKLHGAGTAAELRGGFLIVLGTFSYCLGSVLAKPLLAEASPAALSGAQALVGAAGLVAVSALLEPVSAATFRAMLQPAALAGLLFLVVFGSFVAYQIFLRLVRDWGAPRAGLYAFTSPVIALLLGAAVYGEPVGLKELLGGALMLAAAAIAVSARPAG